LLAPITWPEPFGLSIVEAMASGTPAIAFNLGAIPELIEEGLTGYVVEDVDAMVDAVRRVREIDPVSCAVRARLLFSPDAMVDSYLEVYRRAMGGTSERQDEIHSAVSA
jgi:glycosyltransferase involved in cell wall biosynthesis